MGKEFCGVSFGNVADFRFVKAMDECLEKKSKKYFLWKKLIDYEKRIKFTNNNVLHNLKRFERKWKALNNRYRQINLYGIEFVGIGETISRLFMYMSDKKQRNKDILYLVLPTFYSYYTAGIVNKKIFEVFRKEVHFVTENNFFFWKYVLMVHSDKVSIDYFDTYKYRGKPERFEIEIGKPLLSFSDRIEKYAKEKMREMEVSGTYICLHAREVATKINNFGDTYEVQADTSILDFDVNTFGSACAYIKDLGFQAVRMGKDESKKCNIKCVIDYANDYYDELMDFYLIANCKFLIGCSSGITAIAAFWGRPVLQTNTVGFCFGLESLPWTKYDMYLPKKFYSKRKKRFLNLFEMMNASYKCDRYKMRYDKDEIELIDNTEEEILYATIEMNEKIDHTWVQTVEEKQYMDKYWKILDKWKDQHRVAYESIERGGKGYVFYTRSISYSYLKDNLYLLDVKESV